MCNILQLRTLYCAGGPSAQPPLASNNQAAQQPAAEEDPLEDLLAELMAEEAEATQQVNEDLEDPEEVEDMDQLLQRVLAASNEDNGLESDAESDIDEAAMEVEAVGSGSASPAPTVPTSEISISPFSQSGVGTTSSGVDSDAEDSVDGVGRNVRESSESDDAENMRRPPLLTHRRPHGEPEERFALGERGSIRYNRQSRYFRAVCSRHDCCSKQRTAVASARASRSGQGRPLGLLAAYLMDAGEHGSAKTHVAGAWDLASRQAGRNFLRESDPQKYVEFTGFERSRVEGEAEEPPSIP